jgi:1-(5-phosphoribosyl)-5-[(5-phosphoribosylamino)methylideneamino] imidazole-4-carboxamide isomerase/N-(5'phosphoribosyl)anthranilate isomerase
MRGSSETMSLQPALTIIPAIDIKDGRAVRLHQGRASQVTDYGDPVERAYEFERTGARWLHVVDLDAAFGDGNNRAIMESIVANVDISVEVSGGIRDSDAVARALETGAHRLTLGTAAVEDPLWAAKMIEKYGQRIVIGLDVRDRIVATHGWTKSAGAMADLIKRFDDAGCQMYMVTDISKDGTLTGPNIELLRESASLTSGSIIASGGVASLDDIASLRELVPAGVEAVIIGKAFYEGYFTVSEACEVAERS